MSATRVLSTKSLTLQVNKKPQPKVSHIILSGWITAAQCWHWTGKLTSSGAANGGHMEGKCPSGQTGRCQVGYLFYVYFDTNDLIEDMAVFQSFLMDF